MVSKRVWLPPPDNPFGEEGYLPKQLDILRSRAPLLLVLCGGGFGKTTTILRKLAMNALENPHTIHGLIAPTKDNAEKVHVPKMDDLRRKFRRINGFDFVRRFWGKPSYTWELVNGSQIVTMTYRNPETWRGPDLASVALDEVAAADEFIAGLEGGSLAMWQILQGRIRGVRHTQRILMTTPRGDTGIVGRVLQDYQDGDPTIQVITASSRDNPSLGPNYIAEQTRNLTPLMIAQEVEGKIIVFSQGFFGSSFSPSASILPRYDIDYTEPILIGIDWGYVNPHIVLGQRTIDEEGHDIIVIFDEVYALNQNDDAIMEQLFTALRRRYRVDGASGMKVRVFADPENKKNVGRIGRKFMQADDFTLMEKKVHMKLGRYRRVYDGLKLLQSLFLGPDRTRRLFLTRNLVKKTQTSDDRPLYEAFRRAKISETGLFTEKRWKHPIDAARYMITGELLRVSGLD